MIGGVILLVLVLILITFLLCCYREPHERFCCFRTGGSKWWRLFETRPGTGQLGRNTDDEERATYVELESLGGSSATVSMIDGEE
ncbi:hypothetical protein M501DRAFT_997669 [Patellaria atrata CBS 101060]|uniref:Uncharacterized protein n=1 Tax=Patellaria atrata CBS 101060 TaxID=1346257 RepID=A0A9P4S6H7_9PEZI|nr:hypothetical protein M501DRAFT_997669 [Patellaria atrata CBS 101060]